ncbi:MAG: hypothetical protein QJR07_08945 [Acetobacteraceae bacterium]|nr:hypothetical protein [Acetobacteraceae bacterium]
MFRKTMIAATLLVGLAGTAGARETVGANAAAYVPPGAGNVVGGGAAWLIGGGTDSIVQRDTNSPAQPGRAARLAAAGGGEAEVLYIEPVPPGARGRDALLLGGGDNAVIVYSDGRPADQG